MGIIKKGINGPFSGKAGSVIGSRWKKVNYIKGLPRVKGTKRAPSPELAVYQQRFKLLNEFLGPISRFLEVGFRQHLARATGLNAAFSFNYDHAFMPSGNALALQYSALQFSRGSLFTAGLEKAWHDGNVLTVTWNTKTYGMGGEADDIAYVIGYNPSTNYYFTDNDVATRQDGMTQLTLQGEAPDGDVHIWLFFADKQGKHVSKTVYIPLTENETPRV